MPTYTVKYSNLKLSPKQKKLIADGITKTHSKFTGANTFFAQVFFQKNESGSHFMGGKLIKNKEIFLNGQIRAGRTLKTKKKLILGLKPFFFNFVFLVKTSLSPKIKFFLIAEVLPALICPLRKISLFLTNFPPMK